MLIKKHIPNFITSLNLAAGFTAIIYAGNNDLITSSWLILVAMVFDFIDGLSARALKAYSDIGKELDSLADVVSFGVAPAIIIYQLISVNPEDPAQHSVLSIYSLTDLLNGIIIILMPICAALRLAKFNIDTTQGTSFKGLPTPANALAVISVIIAANFSGNSAVKSFTESPVMLSLYSLILSILMVSRLPLLSLKTTSFKIKGNEGRYILIGLIAISLITMGIAAAPLIIPIYLVTSLFSLAFKH